MNGNAVADLARANINHIRETLGQKNRRHDSDDVWALLQSCRFGTELVEGSWQRVQQKMRGVTEGRILARIVRQYLTVADGALSIFDEFRESLKEDETVSDEEKQTVVLSLGGYRKRVEEAQSNLGSLLTWLEKPPPHVDLSSLDRPGNVPKAEGYINLDDILAKLTAGEDV